ncbi:AAA family ATPase [Roseomonas alkaliterrae]|uniref:Exodeoxyribonuclease-5 n=1 Tax=Neoroseomonas alkaliterrae TaxID=1452450 RepID=A0A840XQJ3_9PROT|nr:DEAD/DEAH box helicase [Neoroseomonas alkaliterrae]MBB5690898.1 exodeoxyribonuclease-5 [Neoroseomonas alkaliterrae]MBR0676038.1 AAA family ATPase [Neoroseomonas alkaliterrae]
MSITPSPQQAAAIASIVDWYRTRRTQQQVFRLFGYAGTGKSTITAAAIEALGLDPMARDGDTAGGVLFAAFTGKAALVMTRKGTPASTIHSFIYRVSEATPEEIARVEKELFDLQRDLRRMGPAERAFAETQISKLQLRLADIHKPSFLLNEQSRVRDAALVVLDEVSMVGPEMAADLLAFGKPILVLGDPGQLPPIKGAGAFTEAPPDVMLTEIHRQAGESAIIRLATMARQGIEIPPGGHDEHVWKLPRNAVDAAQMLRGGQVICGRNSTRLWLNGAMKAAAGFPATYPEGRSEKIICLKNRHDLGLVNGMFVNLTDIEDDGPLSFRASVTTEDGLAIAGRHRFYKGHYDDHVRLQPDRARQDWRELRGLIETSWGYAITCHKAQGSQWENVVVYDDGLSRTPEDRGRWLYTAITRAERGLVLLD